MIRIVEKADNILDFELYSRENNLVKVIRVKIELDLNKSLVLGIRIFLSVSGLALGLFG